MNTFYIVRHGETENNRSKRLSGWVDTPLTKDELLPLQKVIVHLKNVPIDYVYSSDLGRAFATAEALAQALHSTGGITKLAGLREVSYGLAENMYASEAYELYPKIDRDTYYTPPKGESLKSMQKRVFATLDELNKIHQNSTIVLVCHSGVMAALNSSHIGEDFGEHNISKEYPHDYVGKFTFADGTVTSFKEFLG